MADLHLDLDRQLQLRIVEFKNDAEKMREVEEFLNGIFEKAQKEAERRCSATKKNKLEASLGLQNGTRRIGAWSRNARTSARTFATRMFTAICNCTNSVRSAVVNRN